MTTKTCQICGWERQDQIALNAHQLAYHTDGPIFLAIDVEQFKWNNYVNAEVK